MKKIFFFMITLLLVSWSYQSDTQIDSNPLIKEWTTRFQTPPFNEIKNEHFLPAIEEGMRLEKVEIDAIINDKNEPTFENTIEAMEKSGRLLSKVITVFGCLNGANTNDELQKISQEIAPMLSKHNDDINLNPKLFERILSIYNAKDKIGLTDEQKSVLKNYYQGFVRSGANLNEEDKAKLRKINEELSLLYVAFRKNHLQQTNAIALVIDNQDDLSGLSDEIINAAWELANSKDLEGKWAFSLQKPSFIPFLQYSEKRDLREKIFKAYVNRGNNNDENDNKEILSRIASLRVQRANLLGYKTHADFVLERNMAKNYENVYKFLNDLWKPAIKRAKMEVKNMQEIIDKAGNGFKLQAWDWWYYAEKLKKEKYALDDGTLRPYFKMENVRKGVFDVASKLYGIKIIRRDDIQVYDPDVEVFEIQESDGTHIGIFYSDYYLRDGKRSGAWSSIFRSQSNINGEMITPLVYNVGNFSKPSKEKPSLLSIDEVKTLFHEFGHALNSLFANTTYPSARRTPRDFVELPSQIMENWAMDRQVLKTYAIHYETGEPIPDELIERLQNSKLFNQGFETVEYLAASFLDMDWHTISDTIMRDAAKFERESLNRIGLIPEIESRYQSTNFAHIFSSGGYSSGYYSYIWAAVLDADAFEAFKETDLFNKELAASFRENVLSKGGGDDAMANYIKFRGAEPKVDALLKRRGLD